MKSQPETDVVAALDTKRWDTDSNPFFTEYYANESLSETTLQRYTNIRDAVLRVLGDPEPGLRVADIGCGAGTQCRLWTERGHRIFGLDINEPLVRLARQRAAEAQINVTFEVGSATNLPWPDQSMDICLMPELLEHVAEWQDCLNECARVLKTNGLLFLSTTNKLCPVQQEFELPFYSWYPSPLKRRYERLAITTRPELVSHAKYPAVNWFTFFSLRSYLKNLGFECMDRFDIAALRQGNRTASVLTLLRAIPLLRFLGHVLTPYTVVIALKQR